MGCVAEGIGRAVDTFFSRLISLALNSLTAVMARTLLLTPAPASIPNLQGLWDNSWEIAAACYGLLILVAGLTLMVYETLQTRYTLKEIAPRLVVGMVAGHLSMFLCATAIGFANALSHAMLGQQVTAELTSQMLHSWTGGYAAIGSDTTFTVLLLVALVVMMTILLITAAVRVILVILLVAAAPILLMFHALPQTEGIAKWFWRTFAACLAVQVAQSLVFITGIKLFARPGETIFGAPANLSGLMSVTTAIALMYVLLKIPSWLLSSAKIGHSSLMGSMVRGIITYKTMGLLKGAGTTAAKKAGGRPAKWAATTKAPAAAGTARATDTTSGGGSAGTSTTAGAPAAPRGGASSARQAQPAPRQPKRSPAKAAVSRAGKQPIPAPPSGSSAASQGSTAAASGPPPPAPPRMAAPPGITPSQPAPGTPRRMAAPPAAKRPPAATPPAGTNTPRGRTAQAPASPPPPTQPASSAAGWAGPHPQPARQRSANQAAPHQCPKSRQSQPPVSRPRPAPKEENR